MLTACILALWVGFSSSTSRLEKINRDFPENEMQVALPLFIQVFLAGGDRFLASNISVFRSLIVDTENSASSRFLVQASIQKDASWLNPYHEDNYYIAAAILPWNNQLESAQSILLQASNARTFDMLPPFYYAFNHYYFLHQPEVGAKWLNVAAEHTASLNDKLSLARISANWLVKSADRRQALLLLQTMAEQTTKNSLKKQILDRHTQVKNLILLDNAAHQFHQKFGRNPSNLEDLINAKLIDSIPLDPFGDRYFMDNQGKAQIRDSKTK